MSAVSVIGNADHPVPQRITVSVSVSGTVRVTVGEATKRPFSSR
ncbi:hypothetical protein [Catelliglobosispora koreensis]|nr:hypothetical protein [Catelliglobosispora koreensis]